MDVYSTALDSTLERVRRELGVAPTARVKSLNTTIEKLRRNNGSGLKSMQDLAGMRIVGDFDRVGQDELVAQLEALFQGDLRSPKVVDRRSIPSHGYRAVHVVVFPDDVPVEIQVRTQAQHEWAELFEKLADRVGRGIRYGEPPSHWMTKEKLESQGPTQTALYGAAYKIRLSTIDLVLVLANSIDVIEAIEISDPGLPELDEHRREVSTMIDELQERLEEMIPPDEQIDRISSDGPLPSDL